MTIRFIIPQVCIKGRGGRHVCRSVPHSPNRTSIMHWGKRARWKKAWEEAVFWGLKEDPNFRSMEKPVGKVEIWCKLYTRQPQDPDNAVASLKPIIDGVVYSGLIESDTEEHCTIKVESIHVNRLPNERTEITIKIK